MATTNPLKNGKTIQELSAYTDSIRIKAADLTAAGLTQTIQFPVKAGQQIRGVGFKLITPFDGGNTSSLTLTAGDSQNSDADGFFAANQIHADATEVFYGPAAGNGAKVGMTFSADGNVNLLFTVVGSDNLVGVNVGDIEVFFNIIDLDSVAEA
tara:strand:+ start:709 stop:1170 length:462 start_codon:yes stop_codon:yes gene_type:complete